VRARIEIHDHQLRCIAAPSKPVSASQLGNCATRCTPNVARKIGQFLPVRGVVIDDGCIQLHVHMHFSFSVRL